MFDESILQVLNGNSVVGAAFLATEQLAVTCAHVVESAGKKKGEKVSLKLKDGETIQALVVSKYWRDVKAEDVAILRFEKKLQGIQPLRLSPSKESKGHTFSTYGFPQEDLALSGGGTIAGYGIVKGIKLLQLRSDEVTPGFSGAPVVDATNKYLPRVVGMVVSILPPDPYQRLGTTAFAVLAETLHQICPELPMDATFEELSDELLALPGMDSIDASIVRKVYGLCFKGITLASPLAIHTLGIHDGVKHLIELNASQENQPRPLAHFAATLANRLRTQQPQLSEAIWAWLSKYAINLGADPNDLDKLIHLDEAQLNPPCLQIILEPYLDQLNADPKNQQYILRARDARDGVPLGSDQKLEASKLAAYVREVALKGIFDRLKGDEPGSFEDLLWIEFCLYNADLSRRVEQWIGNAMTRKTLGQRFKVVVRSRYRWDKRTDFFEAWFRKWGKLKEVILTNPLGPLTMKVIKQEMVDTFKQAVENAEVLGILFELSDDRTGGNLLTALLESGVPVAIWVRQGTDVQLAEKWLSAQIEHTHDVRHLAEHVRRERQMDSDLGKSLVLLWDNFDHKLDAETAMSTPGNPDEAVPW